MTDQPPPGRPQVERDLAAEVLAQYRAKAVEPPWVSPVSPEDLAQAVAHFTGLARDIFVGQARAVGPVRRRPRRGSRPPR
ncbi:hypothetical protein [Kitasatospora sp. NPDC085464]|uniref:hypothetical protein n=1 Tax=Kitasatospora sp. NPDC085464 TaxID=3364063 RepID=UPI0037C5B1DE